MYVDTESLLKPLLAGLAVNRDVMSQVGMMQSVMLSRPNLEKVAQQTDLMLTATTRAEQEAVIDSLASRISLGRPMGPAAQNTFEVSFNDVDPKVAHNVVRILLDTFMEDSLGLKRTDTAVAQRFLESQIKEYERRLVEAEDRLAAFKQQNVGSLPGTAGDYFQRLETEMGTLQQLRQTYSQMQMRRDELARQLEGEEPTFGLMGSSEGNPIDGQIARFKAQRDQLLMQYTEKHPQVQSLTDTIARLEEEKRGGAKVSSSVAAPGAGLSNDEAMVRSLDMNPVYQSLRLSLSQADADLAAVRGQMQAQQAVVAELRSRVEAIPEVEAELARLNRDYEINKKQFDTFLQRLESAKISEQAEQSNDNVKFRVIEPPSVPVKPSGPDARGTQPAGACRLARRGHRLGRVARDAASDVCNSRDPREGHRRSRHWRDHGGDASQRRALVSSSGGTRGRRGQSAARGLRAQPGLVGTAAGDAARRCRLRSHATCPLSNVR